MSIWTQRQAVRLLVITALLWAGLVASMVLEAKPVGYLFVAALAVTKVYIFGRMFRQMRRESKAIDAIWGDTFATLDRIEADLDRREREEMR